MTAWFHTEQKGHEAVSPTCSCRERQMLYFFQPPQAPSASPQPLSGSLHPPAPLSQLKTPFSQPRVSPCQFPTPLSQFPVSYSLLSVCLRQFLAPFSQLQPPSVNINNQDGRILKKPIASPFRTSQLRNLLSYHWVKKNFTSLLPFNQPFSLLRLLLRKTEWFPRLHKNGSQG